MKHDTDTHIISKPSDPSAMRQENISFILNRLKEDYLNEGGSADKTDVFAGKELAFLEQHTDEEIRMFAQFLRTDDYIRLRRQLRGHLAGAHRDDHPESFITDSSGNPAVIQLASE